MPTPPNAPNTVPLVNVESGDALNVRAERADAARRKGFNDYTAGSAVDAAGAGAMQGVTLGYSDELKGAAAAIGNALATGKLDRTQAARAYTQARDDYRRKLAQLETAHPDAYTAGRVAGGVATGAATAAIPGLNGVAGAALLGGADALGNNAADLTTPDGRFDAAKDVVLGAGVSGAGAHILTHAPGAAALRTAAEDAYLAQHGLTPAKLGEPGQAAARESAGRAIDELAPGTFSSPHSPEQLHSAAHAGRLDSGAKLDQLYGDFDRTHGATVDPRRLAQEIHQTTAEAVKSKPELIPAVRKAIRSLNPEEYDAAEKGWNLQQHADAAANVKQQAQYKNALESYKLARAKAMTPQAMKALKAPTPPPVFTPQDFPWDRWAPRAPMTLADTQSAINRMRDIGAAPEGKPMTLTKAELDADKDVFTPAWRGSANNMRDAIAQHGGPEASAAINPERSRYGDLRGLEKAHGNAERNATPTGIGTKIRSALAIPGAAAGTVLGTGHSPGMAAATGTAVAVGQHLTAPRAPQMLNAASKGVAAVAPAAPAMQQIAQSYGRYFVNQSPERRAVIEHKLMAASPRYAALRQQAAKELAAKADGHAPEGGGVDPHGEQNPTVNVAK